MATKPVGDMKPGDKFRGDNGVVYTVDRVQRFRDGSCAMWHAADDGIVVADHLSGILEFEIVEPSPTSDDLTEAVRLFLAAGESSLRRYRLAVLRDIVARITP